ncbi:MAG: hypothetical protein AB7U73_00080 [Pirellulales bacterium]
MNVERLFDSTGAQLILSVAVVAIAVTVGVYVIGRVRKSSRESPPTASDLLTNFRDLHSQGELSDEEFRTIKSMLAERMQQELTENNRKG